MRWQITNARIVEPNGTSHSGGLVLDGHLIASVLGAAEAEPDLLTLNLHGLSVFPALINAHDSLIATYAAFAGEGRPYLNWLAHDNELKASPLFRERMLLDVAQLYALGAYKNLLGGATFVVDHIPHFVREPFQSSLPVDVLQNFGIGHSAVSYGLGWGDSIEAEYALAAEQGRPYIIHIAEGFDPESAGSLRQLDREGGLGEHTVLVHGLSLSENDFDRIAKAGASLVWCPSSNMFLYGKTLRVAQALSRGIPVCIGTDSAMTGSINMLSELKTAASLWERITGDPVDPNVLFSMATETASRVFRLPKRGEIAAGKHGDLLILKHRQEEPTAALVNSSVSDVYLVVRSGLPVFGEETPAVETIFTQAGVVFDRFDLKGGGRKIAVKGLRALLDDISHAIGSPRVFDFLPLS
ncbi:MAG: amidohydrolase family protein [Spirochaetia bacterium]|nr:amidohydrolase family protein [Spirochaetia bacterium]